MFFDPMHLMFIAPALLLAFWAQWRVKSAYAEAKEVTPTSGMSGREAAERILQADGITNVHIEPTDGFLGDHYDSREKVLRLSSDVYNGHSLAAVGIAAHEAGHAIQDARGYAPLVMRNGIVPLAIWGPNLALLLFIFGAAFQAFHLILLGIGVFSLVVFFQLVNLPVEFNASSRAKQLLVTRGIISPHEQGLINKVLDAAALTYVAATLQAVLTLLYYLVRFGIIGGRRQDD